MPTYSLHGLQVASTIELPLRIARSAHPADLSVHWAHSPRDVPDCPAPGLVLAALDLPGGAGYTVSESEEGYVVRFYGHCDFMLNRGLDRIDAQPSPRCSSELAALFLLGPVLSIVLTLQGRCVLHASAVRFAGGQLAFIGPSNHGKSTLAASLCNAGATLIADDALRCDADGEEVLCYPSADHIRLREGARALAPRETQEATRTVDGRLAMKAMISDEGPFPLHALVTPRLSTDCADIALHRISGVEALTELARSTRVTGWRVPKFGRQQFHLLAVTGRKVPVFALRMPRGAVFTERGRETIVDALLHLLRAQRR